MEPLGQEQPPTLSGWTVGEQLGAGGYGAVWSVSRPGEVSRALKVGHTTESRLVARFEREAEALAALGAPHTPDLIDNGTLDDGRPFILMERLGGATLEDVLRAGPVPRSRSRTIALRLLECVDAAHRRGLVHRDLKPSNVFVIDALERVALTDFGLVRQADLASDLTRTGAIVGTSAYMAPEVCAGDTAEVAADIYSTGIILYELLTGRVPFLGDAAAMERGHLELRPPRPSLLAPVDPALERAVLACLRKHPGSRPASASAIIADLEATWSVGETDGPVSRTITATTTRRITRSQQGSEAVVVVVVDGDIELDVLNDTVLRYRGILARQRGRRSVVVFTPTDAVDPGRSALAFARVMCEQVGARAALERTEVAVRRRGGAPRILGAAVDHPESWLPHEPWSGLHAGTLAPSNDNDGVPLFGRDAELRSAREAAIIALVDEQPALLTIWGADRTGRSRLASECATIARELDSRTQVIELRGDRADPGRTARELADAVNATNGPLAPALLAAARRRPVAIVVDDAHVCDDATLDALEQAALDSPATRLWIVVAASPLLGERRRSWGERAMHRHQIELGALPDQAAEQLIAHLLLPADFPPADIVRELMRSTGSLPGVMIDVVAALCERGLVRKRDEASGWYVAGELLTELPTSLSARWLAAAILDQLGEDLAAFAHVCAVLGPVLDPHEIAEVDVALERTGAAGSAMDPDIGTRRLCDAGVLELRGGVFQFRQPAVAEGIYALTDPADRAAVHQAALAHWRSRPESTERCAMHAAALGLDEAADLYLELADRARDDQAHTTAERAYARALELSTHEHQRLRARMGRGAVLYRMDRHADAVTDLRAAAALAGELGRVQTQIRCLLEEATALDWIKEYERSAACVEAAAAMVEASTDAQLVAAIAMGRGRAAWRAEDRARAVRILGEAADAAGAADAEETQTIALVLLGPALVVTGDLDGAARRFAEAIELTQRRGDRFHEGVLRTNRMFYWQAIHDYESGAADLRAAIAIARELGHSIIELAATNNLADILHSGGIDDTESLRLARRALTLAQRVIGDTVNQNLLVARIHAIRDEPDRAREALEPILSELPDRKPSVGLLGRALAQYLNALAEGSAEFSEIVEAGATSMPPTEYLEVLYWWARAAQALERQDWYEAATTEATRRLDDAPLWRKRIEALA